MSLNQRQQPLPVVAKHDLLISSRASMISAQTQGVVSSFLLSRSGLLSVLALLLFLVVFVPLPGRRPVSALLSSFSPGDDDGAVSRWKDYTVARAAAFAARNDTLIVTAVSEPFLPLLNNWLISVARQKRQDQVLIFAEDYATLYEINRRWPGHAVLVQPAPDSQTAHNFGSQGFFNITSRRPRHLLDILELGYSVMYNDVDMVWVADPFRYLEGNHDVYFADDEVAVKPLNHSHDLPPPGADGHTYVCSCMLFLRPTRGAKKAMSSWIQEIQNQPWSENTPTNDQPAFNSALSKTAAGEVDLYLLPQAAFPPGGLYFQDGDWVERTRGLHAIVHNNYILGFQNKIRRFKDYGLWLADDHADESPLGRI
ncbi:UDP-D-xylose:L-fucose alpha-1,3-D-xylosyltransferase MGP4-like [Curcuma longa]|uniref:UDP-D-xylose:L-fucose alpha-1,3-D-xylosyltransferase MGP4-like n=1 Tax=Curcuma longa TaxID=136217 RepID=UPI003D9F0250